MVLTKRKSTNTEQSSLLLSSIGEGSLNLLHRKGVWRDQSLPPFIDKGSEAQRGKGPAQGHTSRTEVELCYKLRLQVATYTRPHHLSSAKLTFASPLSRTRQGLWPGPPALPLQGRQRSAKDAGNDSTSKTTLGSNKFHSLSLTIFALAQVGQLRGYIWTNPNQTTFSFSSTHQGTIPDKQRPFEAWGKKNELTQMTLWGEGVVISVMHAVVAENITLKLDFTRTRQRALTDFFKRRIHLDEGCQNRFFSWPVLYKWFLDF